MLRMGQAQKLDSFAPMHSVEKVFQGRVDSRHTCIFIKALSPFDALFQLVEKLSLNDRTWLSTLGFTPKRSPSHAIFAVKDLPLRGTWRIMKEDTTNKSKYLTLLYAFINKNLKIIILIFKAWSNMIR